MLTPGNTALLLIDIQGRLATLMYQRERLFRNLRILVRGARIFGIPILWFEQAPEALGPTVPEIAELLAGLQPMAKLSFSACGLPEAATVLRATGRRQLLLAGIETHICVYQTARDLLSQRYYVEVVADAVSSRTPENRHAGLDRMQRLGAHASTVEMALFELLRSADNPKFREIARLVK